MSENQSTGLVQTNSKKKVRNSLNYEHTKQRYEKNTMPSQTIPDQSLSVKQILERYTSGRPIGNVYTPIYDGEDFDMPDPRTLDLAERQELAQEYKDELRDIEERRRQKPQPTPSPEPEPTPDPTPELPAPTS